MAFFHDLLLPSSGFVNVDGVNMDVRMERVFEEKGGRNRRNGQCRNGS